MRKIYLFLFTMLVSFSTIWAAEFGFDFTGTEGKYGMPYITGFSPKEFVELPYEITEGNVQLTLNPISKGGYALCGNSQNQGLFITGYTDGSITVSVAGGTITKIGLRFSLMSQYLHGVTINGQDMVLDSEENLEVWEGTGNNIKINFEDGASVLKNLFVTYVEGGDQPGELYPAGLSFKEEVCSLKLGEEFTAPAFVNPYNLPVTWTSSNPDVATVDNEGNVTVVAVGETVITAKSEETEEYLAGEASYTLQVLDPSASSEEVIDLTKLDSTFNDVPSPYVVKGQNFTATFTSTSTFQPKKGSGLVLKQNGVGTITLAGEGKEITKVVIVSQDQIALTVNGNVLPEGEDENYNCVYTWIRPSDYTEDGVVIDFSTKVWNYELNRTVVSILIEFTGEVTPPGPVMVEKSATINFDDPTASTLTQLELPYTFEGKGVSYTAQDHTPTNVKYEGFWVSERGMQMKAGTGTMVASANGNKVTKVVIQTEGEIILKVDDVQIPMTSEEDARPVIYTWERPEDYTADNVTIAADTKINQNTNSAVYFSNVTISYETESDGRIDPELTFTDASKTLSTAEKTFDPASILYNPEGVEVTYTSSDENVATVTAGVINLIGDGTVTIIASSEETDVYNAAEVSFILTVVDGALNVTQFSMIAPNTGDKVKVTTSCPLYVAASLVGSYEAEVVDEEGNSSIKTLKEAYIFVEDKFGTPTVVYNGNSSADAYKTDDTIENAWTATNTQAAGISQYWAGAPTKSSRAMGWFDAPVSVSSLKNAELAKVVKLEKVALEAGAPAEKVEFPGTFNGELVSFANLVNTTAQKRGVYDITGAPGLNSEGAPVFYPIQYTLVEELPEPPLEFPEELNITFDDPNVSADYDYDEYGAMLIIGGKSDKESVIMTIEVPTGWDGFIGAGMDDAPNVGPLESKVRKAPVSDDGFMPIDYIFEEGDYAKGNRFSLPVGAKASYYVMLYKGDDCYMDSFIACSVNISKMPTVGVEEIEAVGSEAKYYDLQGVEVKNPKAGVYVKVVDGKATKVVIR